MKYAETYSGRNDFLFFCHFYDTTKRRAEGITISKSMSWMIIWWCSSSHKKYPVWTPFLTTTAAAHLCCVSHVVYCFFSSKNFPTSPRRPSASFSATILGLTITVKISWELQNRRYKMVYFCLLLIALKGFYKHQKKTPQILRERGWEEGLNFQFLSSATKKDLNPLTNVLTSFLNSFKYYTEIVLLSQQKKPYELRYFLWIILSLGDTNKSILRSTTLFTRGSFTCMKCLIHQNKQQTFCAKYPQDTAFCIYCSRG